MPSSSGLNAPMEQRPQPPDLRGRCELRLAQSAHPQKLWGLWCWLQVTLICKMQDWLERFRNGSLNSLGFSSLQFRYVTFSQAVMAWGLDLGLMYVLSVTFHPMSGFMLPPHLKQYHLLLVTSNETFLQNFYCLLESEQTNGKKSSWQLAKSSGHF